MGMIALRKDYLFLIYLVDWFGYSNDKREKLSDIRHYITWVMLLQGKLKAIMLLTEIPIGPFDSFLLYFVNKHDKYLK